MLFNPRLQTPIKTLDLPVAAKLYSAQTLPLIVDMINIVAARDIYQDDTTGEETITVLKNVRKAAYLLNGNHPSSLGLHPVVYFYSQEGRHKSASFLAITDFVTKLEVHGKLNDFTSVRAQFEQIILDYDYLAQQINRKYRVAQKIYVYISLFFKKVMEAVKSGMSEEEVVESLQATRDFSYLSPQKILLQNETSGKKFNSEAKSAVYIREVLTSAPKCKICGGYIHRNAISIDHIVRRRDGGTATVENGQLTHPYCNSGYKS